MRAILIVVTLLAPLSNGLAQPVDPQLKKAVHELVADIKRGQPPVVNFLFDSDHLSQAYYPMLDAVAEYLLENGRVKLVLLGHACVIGTQKYNYELAKRRAEAVREYLVGKGVPPPTISCRSFGYSVPKKDNSTEEGRQENRRVEMRFTARDWDSVF